MNNDNDDKSKDSMILGKTIKCIACKDTGWQLKSDCHYDWWYDECSYCDTKPTKPSPKVK